MPGCSMFRKALGMSALIGLVLLYFRERPVEFARSHFAVTVFTDARDIDLQGRAAVRAVEVSARGRRLRIAVADEGPVFAPTPQLLVRAADDLALGVNRVVEAF